MANPANGVVYGDEVTKYFNWEPASVGFPDAQLKPDIPLLLTADPNQPVEINSGVLESNAIKLPFATGSDVPAAQIWQNTDGKWVKGRSGAGWWETSEGTHMIFTRFISDAEYISGDYFTVTVPITLTGPLQFGNFSFDVMDLVNAGTGAIPTADISKARNFYSWGALGGTSNSFQMGVVPMDANSTSPNTVTIKLKTTLRPQ